MGSYQSRPPTPLVNSQNALYVDPKSKSFSGAAGVVDVNALKATSPKQDELMMKKLFVVGSAAIIGIIIIMFLARKGYKHQQD